MSQPNPASDFQTVARALRFFGSTVARQPSVAEIAAAVGLTASELGRLFYRWAGVEPEEFFRSLTLSRARARLNASDSPTEDHLASPPPPRPFPNLHVLTTPLLPGEARAMGRSLTVRRGFAETPFGPALFGLTDRGLCHLAFIDPQGGKQEQTASRTTMDAEWPEARIVEDAKGVRDLARTLFKTATGAPGMSDRAAGVTIHLLLKGTPFQIRIWNSLLRIPPGRLTSYGELSTLVNGPGSARAVGNAVGRNPVAFIIPCHRVIRKDGRLGGYRWGMIRKRALLGWEGARFHLLRR